jgi:hypothetical protein
MMVKFYWWFNELSYEINKNCKYTNDPKTVPSVFRMVIFGILFGSGFQMSGSTRLVRFLNGKSKMAAV